MICGEKKDKNSKVIKILIYIFEEFLPIFQKISLSDNGVDKILFYCYFPAFKTFLHGNYIKGEILFFLVPLKCRDKTCYIGFVENVHKCRKSFSFNTHFISSGTILKKLTVKGKEISKKTFERLIYFIVF